MGDLSPFDFFRQETSNADVVIRTEAMSKMILVCCLMTPEKVRGDFIPYIQTKLQDMDQVLVWMGRRLGDILPFIGGSDHAATLIPVFEALCNAEETTVRSAASASACKVLAKLKPSNNLIAQAYLQLLKKLSDPENGEIFYSRVSAAQICPEVYRALQDPADIAAAMELFSALSRDEMAIVRRAVAVALPQLAEYVNPSILGTDILQLLKHLIGDESPPVQITIAGSLSTIAKVFLDKSAAQPLADLVPLIKNCCDDHSWRMRSAIAQNFSYFATCFSAPELLGEVFASLGVLLLDTENDIRVAACNSTAAFVTTVGFQPYLAEVVPICQQLSDDDSPPVRKAVADLVVDSAVKVGQDLSALHLNTLIVKFLGDADPMVRIRVISKLSSIAEFLPQLFNRLTPTIVGLFSDTNWRVRKQLILSMPAVVQHLGSEYFLEQFLPAFLLLFKDGVSETREAAAEVLPVICNATHSNSSWVHDQVFPVIKAMATDEYLLRVSMLGGLAALMSATILSDRFLSEIVALALGAAVDPVPNIRLRAAQILTEIVRRPGLPSEIMSEIRPRLSDMSTSDKDKDVKYFAAEALKLCVI